MNHLTKVIVGAGLLAVFAWLPYTCRACSLASCLNRGVEVPREFTAVVRQERKPLAGVTVEIHTSKSDDPYFTGLTDNAGKATIRGLAPGDYWISVTYFGISAGYQCFHVLPHSTVRARRRLNYNWGDWGIPMRLVTGHLREWQPGTGGTPIWNLSHGTTVPIAGSKAQLQNATTRETLRAISDASGAFAFPHVDEGTYVLHFDGSSTGSGYDPTNLVITVSHKAMRESLTFTRQENGCGGATLHPESR